jgi:hypothetical protein
LFLVASGFVSRDHQGRTIAIVDIAPDPIKLRKKNLYKNYLKFPVAGKEV